MWRPLLAVLKALGVHWMLRKVIRRKIAILIYHNIVPDGDTPVQYLSPLVKESEFRRQIRYLKSAYHVLSMDELTEALTEGRQLPPNSVAITFDDAYANHCSLALPILKECDVPATFYMSTGFIGAGKLFWWDELEYMIMRFDEDRLSIEHDGGTLDLVLATEDDRIRALKQIARDVMKTATLDAGERFMSAVRAATGMDAYSDEYMMRNFVSMTSDMVGEMRAAGMRFGSHTVNHPILPNETREVQDREIRGTIDMLDTGRPLHFCYPNGSYNEDTVEILKQCGFVSAITTAIGYVVPGDDLFKLNRISARAEYNDFIMTLAGLQFVTARIDRLLKRNK
ncbi:MAG: polysaccharide deacetylase family protein [Verrucomicrobia bacterium]|nr:polysaccharide deacetylase family protein [Verrucomicrobiota bacterium]